MIKVLTYLGELVTVTHEEAEEIKVLKAQVKHLEEKLSEARGYIDQLNETGNRKTEMIQTLQGDNRRLRNQAIDLQHQVLSAAQYRSEILDSIRSVVERFQ